jgi:hypothetical protein
MTFYPHLSLIKTALEKLNVPVQVYANVESVSIQTAPCLILIPEATQVLQTIGSGRTISGFRFKQDWLLLTVLRDASDQLVTDELVSQLGEWQYRILQVLMKDVLQSGGPIQLNEGSKSEVIAGGAIAGQLRFASQFVINAE